MPPRVGVPLLERYVVQGDCWIWTSVVDKDGYGRPWVPGEGRRVHAHRVFYEAHVGPVPDGLQLDHLCRNRACVNPAHLEPVTPQENIRRGEGVQAKNGRKTHCPQGHPYDEANTYRAPADGRRSCRVCIRAASRRSFERKRVA